MTYHIVTFGCAANEADSERVAAHYSARGLQATDSIKTADVVIINTCMIRQMAENRVYGLVHNLSVERDNGREVKIIVTGCMTGMAVREKSGKMFTALRRKMPQVDEFLPIEEVGFDHVPLRGNSKHALVPITNGCNNFCTFCVVPLTRGREVSRPMDEILAECLHVAQHGYTRITLIGQNVNSYGSDLVKSESAVGSNSHKVTFVKHLGRLRIPTLFPHLLREIAAIDGIEKIDFISSNPWDFSDDLIDTIATQPKISRQIHLPVQSGDTEVLRRMNRWYTRQQYLTLVEKIRSSIPEVSISTDIIVGFPGETTDQFDQTVSLARQVNFSKAYIAMYSDRPMTAAHKVYADDVPHAEKKRRWEILEEMINRENLRNGTYK
jgi:tRNA-2-methylthio-N6-dimethylallyladenosine synthase